MAVSASRHGSLPLSTPSLYSNVTQSASQSGSWLPLTPSTNPKLSFIFGQQPLEELHGDIFRPSPAVELPDPDQLILLGDNLKAAFIKTLAFDHEQTDEGLNIDHCITILEELQWFQLNMITIQHITQVEYMAVLAFMCKSHIEIKVKQVPDIMGVMHCVNQFGNDKSFVRWLVKAGFSQSDASIMRKFGHMVKNNLDIKKLIRVSIDEDGMFQGPEEHTEVTKSLRKSGSWMNHTKFKSLVHPKQLT
ncbi:hypothetical protein EDB19DRAFT_1912077 [Suillus lakei]|nr:hypothetical protein EDB19DRAFT_1912077 [Suillus lakei]